MSRIAGRFTRAGPRRRARQLVLGLLSDLPRKNCWTIAEWAGGRTLDGMQHLLGRPKWDADQVRDWQKLSAGAGAKGQRFYDRAVIDLTDPRAGAGSCWASEDEHETEESRYREDVVGRPLRTDTTRGGRPGDSTPDTVPSR